MTDDTKTESRKVTMADIFARDKAKREADAAAQQAWEQTPEGKAWRTEQDVHHARMAAADQIYAEEHPITEDEETLEDESENPS